MCFTWWKKRNYTVRNKRCSANLTGPHLSNAKQPCFPSLSAKVAWKYSFPPPQSQCNLLKAQPHNHLILHQEKLPEERCPTIVTTWHENWIQKQQKIVDFSCTSSVQVSQFWPTYVSEAMHTCGESWWMLLLISFNITCWWFHQVQSHCQSFLKFHITLHCTAFHIVNIHQELWSKQPLNQNTVEAVESSMLHEFKGCK